LGAVQRRPHLLPPVPVHTITQWCIFSSPPLRGTEAGPIFVDSQLSRAHCRCCAWIVCLFLSPAAAAYAQSAPPQPSSPVAGEPVATTALLHGVVTSKTGEVYQGVRVTLSLSGVPASQSVITDSDGAFTFPNLPAGTFTLTFSSDGFAPRTVSGTLEPGQIYDAKSIVLAVRGTASEVRVSAETQVEIAQEQIHVEEQQRVLGVLPNFYVSYDPNPVPLTTRQKYSLAWQSNINPFTLVLTGAFAGIEQADNTFDEYGQGMQGYGKRFGAFYADGFIDNMIAGAFLPSLFKQDPRYFYKGTGTIRSRAGYAMATAIVCKGDNMRWQFNYSGIIGGLASGAISNLYYPASDRSGAALTFENAGIGIVAAMAQNLFQEFLVKKLTPGARKSGRP